MKQKPKIKTKVECFNPQDPQVDSKGSDSSIDLSDLKI